jgi:hypothetical protein
MKALTSLLILCSLLLAALPAAAQMDTGQDYCYDTRNQPMPCPQPGEALFGQDANYRKAAPAYQDNGDGTITDLNTGLMWQAALSPKVGWQEAMDGAASQNTGGYTDWRVPTIKELYSLINFNGVTPTNITEGAVPYLDTTYFGFAYGAGSENPGDRTIDVQFWSSTLYVSTTMDGSPTAFGVNFADGRIKGYGTDMRNPADARYVRYVRGESTYGQNAFTDNGDGTISDANSGLMWMQADSGSTGMPWAEALAWCEASTFANYEDWRLPDAKELQNIVDYSRSPDTTSSATIDPLFQASVILDEGGSPDYGFYWTSTSHLDGPDFAVYLAFGEAQGFMDQQNTGTFTLLDVHGAGAQRSDPKSGDPADHPVGNGPQGDVIRIYNLARCVRGGEFEIFTGGDTAGAPVSLSQMPSGGGQQGGQQGGGQQGGGQQGGPQGGPPQEAFDACQGLAVGAACTINTPNGALNGTCQNIQEGFACVPPR